MYEGAPNWPEPDRFWRIIDKEQGHNPLYRADCHPRVHALGRQWPNKHDLSSLRLLGTVGEPINPEAWMWYYNVIGHKRCPIVDTWWQTETGSIMITPLPGAIPTKPGQRHCRSSASSRGRAKEGQGTPAERRRFSGHPSPWPSMLRTIYGDPERYKKQYWSEVPHVYFTGDGAAATRTAISGSWAASTMCSTSPATASAPPRSKARSVAPESRRGRGCGPGRMTLRAEALSSLPAQTASRPRRN